MLIVKTKRDNVVTYIRPSLKAVQATCYKKAGQQLNVNPCIQGWFEIRQVGKDGVGYAEFISSKDVRYTVRYLATVLAVYLARIIGKTRYEKVRSKAAKLFRRGLSAASH